MLAGDNGRIGGMKMTSGCNRLSGDVDALVVRRSPPQAQGVQEHAFCLREIHGRIGGMKMGWGCDRLL